MSVRGMSGWKQLELFEREAQLLRGLAHPGIPRYIDYLEEDTLTDRAFFLVQACSTSHHFDNGRGLWAGGNMSQKNFSTGL
jgi:serine/threonine protein kinase